MLLAFPTSTTGERKNPDGSSKSNYAIIQERIANWNDGETKRIWANIQHRTGQNNTARGKTERSAHSQEKTNRRRAVQCAKDGAYAKALRALDSRGAHSVTEEVIQSLLHKHPQSTDQAIDTADFEPTTAPPTPSIPPVSPTELQAAINRFPTGSSGGGSGLTPRHLAQLTACPDASDEQGLISALAAFLTHLLRGKGPPGFAPWLCGAPVTALRKPDNGVRPIAVGETLRRLAASIILHREKQRIQKLLAPHQFGVATSRGAETIIHTARAWARNTAPSQEQALLQVDLTNAFNLINRQVFLREINRHLPSLGPWVSYCYGGLDPHLWCNNYHFRSHTGVQQGDPLGPLLFAMALRPVLRELHKHLQPSSPPSTDLSTLSVHSPTPDHHIMFYMDDGIITGHYTILLQALCFLNSHSVRQHGLELCTHKTKIWWPSPASDSIRNLFPADITHQTHTGTLVLNSPLGPVQYQRNFMLGYTRDKIQTMRKLPDLQDAHVTFTLLRATFSVSQLAYHLRTTPPQATEDAALEYDAATTDVLRSLTLGRLPDDALEELSLPLRMETSQPHAGLGMTSAKYAAPAAYLASKCQTHNSTTTILGARTSSALSVDPTAHDAHRRLQSWWPKDLAMPSLQDLQDDPQTQRQLSQAVDSYRIQNLQDKSHRGKVLRQALSLPGAKDWARCQPLPVAESYIDDRSFRTWFSFYVHQPLFNRSPPLQADNTTDEAAPLIPCVRPKCRNSMDTYGDHLLGCTASARATFSPTIRRHDQLTILLEAFLRSAARSPIREPRERVTGDSSRPDILALGARGGEDLIDVAITHIASSTGARYITRHDPHVILKNRHQNKLKTHAAYAARRPGSRIVPLIFAATGGMSHETHRYLREIAQVIATRSGYPTHQALTDIRSRLAARLVMANASALLSGAVD